MIPVFRRNPDCHISATAYHNMVLIFSSGPYHYLFLTALVHPLSTCAYLLLLSHCNNYILPSHSRQPKLASCILHLPVGAFLPVLPLLLQPACFSMSSGWSISSPFYPITPTRLLLDGFRLELFFPFRHFCSNLLTSRCLPVGAPIPVFTLLLQPACFSISSGWSFPSHFSSFTPACLLLDGFRLELSFPLRQFSPTRLQACLQRCMCLACCSG